MRILNQPMISQDNVINKLRNAIMHRGLWMGLILKEVKEFANTFFTEDIKKVFEIEVIKIDENEFKVAYGYCPLVTAWQQIGIDGEMLATLCDIAMSGDRAICSRFGEFEFHLGKTIAQGHRVCEVCFTRKRQQYRQ